MGREREHRRMPYQPPMVTRRQRQRPSLASLARDVARVRREVRELAAQARRDRARVASVAMVLAGEASGNGSRRFQ